MPVKWTPDNDQLLLLKILETHDISVDAKKISAAWPSDKGEVPTARAITERLVRIRQLARVNGAGHFGISSSQAKSSSGKPGTPRKPLHMLQAPQSSLSPGAKSLVGRLGQVPGGNRYDDDDDDEEGALHETPGVRGSSTSPSKRKHDALHSRRDKHAVSTSQVKVESIETDGFEIVEDGSSLSGAARSPSTAHRLQQTRAGPAAARNGVAGTKAQVIPQPRTDDDGSLIKRLRLENSRAECSGTKSASERVGSEWGGGHRAQSLDEYVDDDDDDAI